MIRNTITLILINLTLLGFSQSKLKAGFDPDEYKFLLEISARQVDTPWTNVSVDYPNGFEMAYRSKVVGLDNRWDLWVNKKGLAVISIRGTTAQATSWLENFYAGMIPTEGALEFDKNKIFCYKVAGDTNAFVHAGWMIGLSVLAPDIIQKINQYYKKGFSDFLIMGHSQGASLAFLLRSYLYYLEDGKIPPGITFKTYASAAPKPGNLWYAYDFEFINRGGWAFRIANSVDWVPTMPIGIQTVEDLPVINPFSDIKQITSKMKPLPRIYVRATFKGMLNKLQKAEKTLRKNLGYKAYKLVNNELYDFKEPEYARSFNYTPCGTPIILKANKNYYENYFNKNKETYKSKHLYLFINHMIEPYYFLLHEYYLN